MFECFKIFPFPAMLSNMANNSNIVNFSRLLGTYR